MNWKVLSSYTATIWNIVAVYIFIPINISVLGNASFGIISYAATFQAFISLLELGVSTVLKRELSIQKESNEHSILVESVDRIYIAIALVAMLGLTVIGYFWADKIIKTQSLNKDEIFIIFTLIIGINLLQLLINIFQGAMWGMNEITKSNFFQIAISSLKFVIPITIVYVFKSDIITYFISQVILLFIFYISIRSYIFKKLNINSLNFLNLNFNEIKKHSSFAGGVFLISLLAALASQTDKIILSSLISIEALSPYYIAFTIAQISTILISPLTNVTFNKLTLYKSQNQDTILAQTISSLSNIMFFAIAFIFSNLLLFSNAALNLWIRNEEIVFSIQRVLPFLLIGGALQAFTVLPFSLSLASKDSKSIIRIQLIYITISIPLNFLLINKFGTTGAAIVWCSTNVIVAPIYVKTILGKHIGVKLSNDYLLKFVKIFSLLIFCHLLVYFFTHDQIINSFSLSLLASSVSGTLSIFILKKISPNDFDLKIIKNLK